ncbi:MAG TPA: dTDP-4-dehydrorhamnose 3,5-epimerase [Candidatus Hydrogenedentes bacterium]|nr:dTDP-4-dehydrorhamnose 3,5-epimerase [Candidatus Hydrogenedentota bacterium]HOL76285.1 dTDP-4-dehydrorhamnose 3,5-epimerase [Candidatus Hydrogenedentota bacterium]
MPMPVEFLPTELEGVMVVRSGRADDQRGYFCELYSEKMWAEKGMHVRFVQDNLSFSHKGVLRGLHYQIEPYAIGKFVRVLRGAAFDVAVDLRRGSPTFGKWMGMILKECDSLALWIPAGFAHGFLALEDNTTMLYKGTTPHVPEAERTLSYRCPRVGVVWPFEPRIISPKDENAPDLDHAEINFTYRPQTSA